MYYFTNGGDDKLFYVVLTGIYSRRKEFQIMQSIGLTDEQMIWMLYGEGFYYILCVTGLLFTVGAVVLLGVKCYMENRLSYFVFRWPIILTVLFFLLFLFINVMITFFAWKKKDKI